MTLLKNALDLLPPGPRTKPANLDALIRQLGVEVRYRRDRLAFDGSTDLDRAVPLIELAWVRRTDSPSLLPWGEDEKLRSSLPHHYDARTRFTLAHEIGHVLLDRLSKQRPRLPSMTPKDIENLCDAIGAELLMPTSWFRDQVGANATLEDLRRVSIRAGTSISSTVVRARNLGYGVAAMHLTPRSPDGWSVDRAYGFGAKSKLRLTDSSEAHVGQLPMKSVVRSTVDLACSDHTHCLQAELRRTYSSALVIVYRVDNTWIMSTRSWRCPER